MVTKRLEVSEVSYLTTKGVEVTRPASEEERFIFRDGFKKGIREVIDWIQANHDYLIDNDESKSGITIRNIAWQAQLKEWGANE